MEKLKGLFKFLNFIEFHEFLFIQTATFRFYISSFITLNHLSVRKKCRLSIKFYKISWFFLKMIPKIAFRMFLRKNNVLSLSFPNHYQFRFQFLEFNSSKIFHRNLKWSSILKWRVKLVSVAKSFKKLNSKT